MKLKQKESSIFKKLPDLVPARLKFQQKMKDDDNLGRFQRFTLEGTSEIPVKVIGFTDLQNGRCTRFFPCHPTDQPEMIGHVLLDFLEVLDPSTTAAKMLLSR